MCFTIHSFDFSPAYVHDVNYLHDIKENFKNCLLIGYRGYISKELQVDLFNYSKINLSVAMRKINIILWSFQKRNQKSESGLKRIYRDCTDSSQ